MNEEEVLLNVLNRKGSENKKYKIEELCKITKIPDERIIKIIKKLKKEGKIYIDSKHLISSFPPHLIVGKIKLIITPNIPPKSCVKFVTILNFIIDSLVK